MCRLVAELAHRICRQTVPVCKLSVAVTRAFDSIRQGGPDKNLCRCFGAPARRVSPDHLITYRSKKKRLFLTLPNFEKARYVFPLSRSDEEMSRFSALFALLATPCAAFVAAPQPLRATSSRRVAAPPTAVLDNFVVDHLSTINLLAEIVDSEGEAVWFIGARPGCHYSEMPS